jgi:nucleotide-binding universal stress UspA family protein
MATKAVKPGWVRPATILFASEAQANETIFAFALAQARESQAKLILFHAYDTLMVATAQASGICYYDHAAAAQAEKQHLEPFAERARQAGIECEIVVRSGLPADRILAFTRERTIDRIVMGTHSPGHVSKLFVGSVAEEVLRHSVTPVYVVGPEVVVPKSGNFDIRTVLCGVSLHESSEVVVRFAAELAVQHRARLLLLHVIPPQERAVVLAGRTPDKLEADLLALVPAELQEPTAVEAIVVSGDPTEELLFQSRTEQAGLIVLGAQSASVFSAIARYGIVYKTLALARCPVITLSPIVLTQYGATAANTPVTVDMPGAP